MLPLALAGLVIGIFAMRGCRSTDGDAAPVRPAPVMSAPDPVRFGQASHLDGPPAAPQEGPPPRQAPPARQAGPAGPPDERAPRPPADIPPDPAASPDSLAQGYDAASRAVRTAPRPASPAGPAQGRQEPAASLALKDLLGRSGFGAHLATALTIRADNGAAYSISAQASRVGAQTPTAYVVLYRDGMRAPVYADLRGLKLSGAAGIFAGGNVDQLVVEGQRFGIALDAAMQDMDCTKKPMSEINLWAASRPDAVKKVTVSAAFGAAAAAGAKLPGPLAGLSIVAYKDQPGGQISIALMGAEPAGGLRPMPAELLSRPDGKLVSLSLLSMPGKKVGLRLAGEGEQRALEVYDLSSPPVRGARPADVPLDSLAPAACK